MKITSGDVVVVGDNSVPGVVTIVPGKKFAVLSWFDPVGQLHRSDVPLRKLRKIDANKWKSALDRIFG